MCKAGCGAHSAQMDGGSSAAREARGEERENNSKAGKPSLQKKKKKITFPDVCMGQTWPFPALPGTLKTVVGKGLGRCSDFPFPDPLDTPNTFHPSNSHSAQLFFGGLETAGSEVVVG